MFVQLLELEVGQKVLLRDGTEVVIVGNPGDGIWVETRLLDAPADAEPTMTHCEEIKERL